MSNWFLPCNPKTFNVVDCLKERDYFIWKQDNRMKKGDTVYAYIGNPYSEIKYRCIIAEADIDPETVKEMGFQQIVSILDRSAKYMKLHMEYEYPDGKCKLAELKAHGLSTIQRQCRIFDDLLTFLTLMEGKTV